MATKAVSEKSLTVLNFLKENTDKNLTAADIAKALGLEKKTVDGVVTSGLQRKGYAKRIPGEVELEDGTHQPIKIIQLTDEGVAYDHQAAIAADVAEKVASGK